MTAVPFQDFHQSMLLNLRKKTTQFLFAFKYSIRFLRRGELKRVWARKEVIIRLALSPQTHHPVNHHFANYQNHRFLCDPQRAQRWCCWISETIVALWDWTAARFSKARYSLGQLRHHNHDPQNIKKYIVQCLQSYFDIHINIPWWIQIIVLNMTRWPIFLLVRTCRVMSAQERWRYNFLIVASSMQKHFWKSSLQPNLKFLPESLKVLTLIFCQIFDNIKLQTKRGSDQLLCFSGGFHP